MGPKPTNHCGNNMEVTGNPDRAAWGGGADANLAGEGLG